MYFGADPEILRRAYALRSNMTSSEKRLWQYLRGRKVIGYRFRRQHAVNQFILDFFCFEKLLGIEVDGKVHNDQTQHERDEGRTMILKRFGIRILRFTNDQIEYDISQVIKEIQNALH